MGVRRSVLHLPELTCDPWDIWSEWWGDKTWPSERQRQSAGLSPLFFRSISLPPGDLLGRVYQLLPQARLLVLVCSLEEGLLWVFCLIDWGFRRSAKNPPCREYGGESSQCWVWVWVVLKVDSSRFPISSSLWSPPLPPSSWSGRWGPVTIDGGGRRLVAATRLEVQMSFVKFLLQKIMIR